MYCLVVSLILHGQTAIMPAMAGKIRECLNAESKVVEGRLTQTYRTVLATYNGEPQHKQLIIQAQREWVRFKEADCKAQAYLFKVAVVTELPI